MKVLVACGGGEGHVCGVSAVCLQLSLVGLGVIAPVSVAWSLVVGAVLSWGVLWPVLSSKEGSWFPAGETMRHAQAVCGLGQAHIMVHG